MSNLDKRCTIESEQGHLSVFAESVFLNRAVAHCKSINQELFNINTAEAIQTLGKELPHCVASNGAPMDNYLFHSGLETYYGVGTWQDGLIYNASDPIQRNLFIYPPTKNQECVLIQYHPDLGKLHGAYCRESRSFICVGTDDSVVPTDSSDVIQPSTCSFETKYGKLNAFITQVSLDDAVDHCRSENQELFVMNMPGVFDVLPSHLAKCAGFDDDLTLNNVLFHAGLEAHYGAGYWRDGLRFNGSDPKQRDLFIYPPMYLQKCQIAQYGSEVGGKLISDTCQVRSSFICLESTAEVNSAAINSDYQADIPAALHGDMSDVQNLEYGYSLQHIFFIVMVASLVIFIVGFVVRSWLRKRKVKKENVEEYGSGCVQSVDPEEGVSDTVYN